MDTIFCRGTLRNYFDDRGSGGERPKGDGRM